jgi:hypothetical protein
MAHPALEREGEQKKDRGKADGARGGGEKSIKIRLLGAIK